MNLRSREQTLEFLLEDRIKLGTVSGILTTKPNLIEWIDKNIPEIELITTKSYQVNPNKGNREPIIVELSVGNYGNAVGLKNPGMVQGHKELKELRENYNLRSLLNVSLSANSIEDFIKLVKKFEDVGEILELNFSCPHAAAGYGSSIGSDVNIVIEYITEIRKNTDALIFPKLTPNVTNIGEIAKAAIDAGADGISAINTVGPEVFIDPYTKKPILYNPGGHKGGKSGEWIKEIAIRSIEEIRKAIGNDYPIIGMGGISTGEDVRRLRDSGANVIGIGSAIARVKKEELPNYMMSLKLDSKNGTNIAESLLSNKRLAEYIPHKITNIDEITNDLRIFELEGSMDYKASQFAFLWVSGVGEKPFSIVKDNPLTFLVRKRGEFTEAMFDLHLGDEIMIRGPYGKEAPDIFKKNAYIVAGGTGIAVVPKLVETLKKQNKDSVVYFGATGEKEIILKDEIEKYATFIPIVDNGRKGRVLDIIKSEVNVDNCCFYNIGPIIFMKKAMEIQKELGADPKCIYVSLETNNMCGIGMCGECECGGKLTCKEGTFFSLDYLTKNNIDIMDLEK